MAVLRTSGQETARILPTSMSLRCSVSPVALLMRRMAVAEATAAAVPIKAFFRLQLGNIVIKQLEIIGDFFFAADGRREHENLTARLTRDTVGRLEVEIRLNKNHLHPVALHQTDQFDGVLRTWGNAGARLDVTD